MGILNWYFYILFVNLVSARKFEFAAEIIETVWTSHPSIISARNICVRINFWTFFQLWTSVFTNFCERSNCPWRNFCGWKLSLTENFSGIDNSPNENFHSPQTIPQLKNFCWLKLIVGWKLSTENFRDGNNYPGEKLSLTETIRERKTF